MSGEPMYKELKMKETPQGDELRKRGGLGWLTLKYGMECGCRPNKLG